MKKTKAAKASTETSDDLRSEYDFDYREARPNRFAEHVARERLVVALDADVSQVFTTAESVNAALRAIIEVMPRNP